MISIARTGVKRETKGHSQFVPNITVIQDFSLIRNRRFGGILVAIIIRLSESEKSFASKNARRTTLFA
ncbi:hypothetical protein HanPSC8_Chr09g0393991 [Helianthus annuus]|nr:hypothetical protein HanPSC8_Chr09g0393991 [Helianthus annuus]